MSTSKSLSHNDMEALRNHYDMTDTAFGTAFGQTPDQVATHISMAGTGLIVATPNLDFASYDKTYGTNAGITSVVKPQTATKPTKIPAKRGRKGDQVVKAFAAIPTTPTDVNKFAADQGVSLHVLRQSKRFDPNPTLGKVRVAKDKTTKTLMISRIKK